MIGRASSRTNSTAALVLALAALAGCATAPRTAEDRRDLKSAADEALGELKAQERSLQPFLAASHGYVVFPRIGKGGYIFGGGYGRGIVYRGGAPIGYADITQATVGLQIGGQAFMEVLVFESARDLERFTTGRLSLTANASAVILKTGQAVAAQYTDGVAVFVKPIGGAMVEAAVGGQQYSFQPE
jgi:lipid-binding SYLF domain-containing protein